MFLLRMAALCVFLFSLHPKHRAVVLTKVVFITFQRYFCIFFAGDGFYLGMLSDENRRKKKRSDMILIQKPLL